MDNMHNWEYYMSIPVSHYVHGAAATLNGIEIDELPLLELTALSY